MNRLKSSRISLHWPATLARLVKISQLSAFQHRYPMTIPSGRRERVHGRDGEDLATLHTDDRRVTRLSGSGIARFQIEVGSYLAVLVLFIVPLMDARQVGRPPSPGKSPHFAKANKPQHRSVSALYGKCSRAISIIQSLAYPVRLPILAMQASASPFACANVRSRLICATASPRGRPSRAIRPAKR
jgi:hypothetical protein